MTFKHKYDSIPPLFNDEAVTFVTPEDMQAIAEETGGEIYTCADTRTKRMEVDVDGTQMQFACEPDAPKKARAASKPASTPLKREGTVSIPIEYASEVLTALERRRDELTRFIDEVKAAM